MMDISPLSFSTAKDGYKILQGSQSLLELKQKRTMARQELEKTVLRFQLSLSHIHNNHS